MRPSFQHLRALAPSAGNNYAIDWSGIEAILTDEFAAMRSTEQSPLHHAEGDVLTHTKMVVESLVADDAWRGLPENRREMLFWTAVLHDVGKPATTVFDEYGRISSRGHSRAGVYFARRFLMEVGAPFRWREEVCGLIEHHQAPFWLLERDDPEKKAIEISLTCNTADLCLHARHDIHGRICQDAQRVLENIDLAEMLFSESECLGVPRDFPNDTTRIEYLEKHDRYLGFEAHETFRSFVILMCGLPGAGKDTWISQHCENWDKVSLDDLRAEMGISPEANQGVVLQAAKERAREHLRAGEDFVWNATNLARQKRAELLSLIRDYGAHTCIVYIEPELDTIYAQNRGREAQVPPKAFGRMLSKLEPPRIDEAHSVMWDVKSGPFFRGTHFIMCATAGYPHVLGWVGPGSENIPHL